MKYDSLVSIIIPYFRKRKFIIKTLQSVLTQTYKNIEVLIIYDDENQEDLLFLKKKIKNNLVKFIINKKNLGAGLSRNIGIKNSKGKYIAFIDSDDVWSKNKLKYQIEFMKKKKLFFSHTSYTIIDKSNNKLSKRIANKEITYKDLLKSCNIGLSTVVIRREVLEVLKFPNLRTKEDYVLWLNISKKTKIAGIKKNLVFWRKLDNSLSSNFSQKILDGFKVYNTYFKYNIIISFIYLIRLSFNFLKKEYLD